MQNRIVKVMLLLLPVLIGAGACSEYPTRAANRRPVISSIVVFPEAIGQGDSTLVTVFATDPDGDTLVYDWFTDGRLLIKGARPGDSDLYHTSSRSRVFYRSTSPPVYDSAWVACNVRDVKGGGDGRQVWVRLID